MTSVVAIGVGVAAAAFLVRESDILLLEMLTGFTRDALVLSHYEKVDQEQVRWARLFTKGVSMRK